MTKHTGISNTKLQFNPDINECQLPRPPCPKYLCENTIGGYKCSGKPGKPFEELVPGSGPVPRVTDPEPDATPKNDICPQGFRAGADDECNGEFVKRKELTVEFIVMGSFSFQPLTCIKLKVYFVLCNVIS